MVLQKLTWAHLFLQVSLKYGATTVNEKIEQKIKEEEIFKVKARWYWMYLARVIHEKG